MTGVTVVTTVTLLLCVTVVVCATVEILDIDTPPKSPSDKGDLSLRSLGGANHGRIRANAIKDADYHCGLNEIV